MIFAFEEDGSLQIHADLAAVQRAYEGVDVDSAVVHFFDASGTYLEPRFTVPNRRGRLLGLFSWVSSGVFELVANPHAPHDSFALALHETTTLVPNPWFKSLEHLKSELAKRGLPDLDGPLDGTTALNMLVAYALPLEPALAVLSRQPGASPHPLVRIDANDVCAVLRRYAQGGLTAEQVTDWADLLECRADIAPVQGQEVLADVLFRLANPGLRGPVTPALARSIEEELWPWLA